MHINYIYLCDKEFRKIGQIASHQHYIKNCIYIWVEPVVTMVTAKCSIGGSQNTST